jgi:hypothetical protein
MDRHETAAEWRRFRGRSRGTKAFLMRPITVRAAPAVIPRVACHSPRRRGIQYAAAPRLNHDRLGILDRPPEPVIRPAGGRTGWRTMTAEYAASFSRHDMPEFCTMMSPSSQQRAQGRPGAHRPHGPRAKENARGGYHRFGQRHPGLPCAMVLTLIRALLGDRLSCPRPATMLRHHRVRDNADALRGASAPGCQDHTISRPRHAVRRHVKHTLRHVASIAFRCQRP